MIRTKIILRRTNWIVCIAVLSLLWPLGVRAEECAQWDMSGIQIFDQSNGYVLQFRSKQVGSEFHGLADALGSSSGEGLVDGSIEGDDLEAIVTWDGGSVGMYAGRVNIAGYPEGITHDRMHPESTASWQSRYKLICLRTSSPLLPPASPGTPPPTAPSQPANSTDLLGVEKPGNGIGKILKQIQPPSQEDKSALPKSWEAELATSSRKRSHNPRSFL